MLTISYDMIIHLMEFLSEEDQRLLAKQLLSRVELGTRIEHGEARVEGDKIVQRVDTIQEVIFPLRDGTFISQDYYRTSNDMVVFQQETPAPKGKRNARKSK